MKTTLEQLRAAVTEVLGSRILKKDSGTLARQAFAYLATVECGATTAQIASELECTMASALNHHMLASKGIADNDAKIVEAIAAAKDALLDMTNNAGNAPLVATSEQADCNHIFTEVDGEHATPAQMLLLTLLAWSLEGSSVMGFSKRHYLSPVKPSNERIVDTMKCVNSLRHPNEQQLNEAISKLFKADYVLN